MKGAEEGYNRTVENMNELEENLGLSDFARSPDSHKSPYFALNLFTLSASTVIGSVLIVVGAHTSSAVPLQ